MKDETAPRQGGPVTNTSAEQFTRWQRPDAGAARALAARRVAEARTPSLRRRRVASYRLPPLMCGHRDPLTCVADDLPFVVGPCRFGLTEDQARRHGNDLIACGWTVREVVETLGIEPKEAA